MQGLNILKVRVKLPTIWLHHKLPYVNIDNFGHIQYMNLVRGSSVNIYLLKAKNRNSRKRCEVCSKLTTKTPEQRH